MTEAQRELLLHLANIMNKSIAFAFPDDGAKIDALMRQVRAEAGGVTLPRADVGTPTLTETTPELPLLDEAA